MLSMGNYGGCSGWNGQTYRNYGYVQYTIFREQQANGIRAKNNANHKNGQTNRTNPKFHYINIRLE